MKAWSGRFARDMSGQLQAFSNCLDVDHHLWREDIAGSIAHARMLGATGIIPAGDAQLLIDGLTAIESELAAGTLELDPNHEDIHMAIEAELTARIGPVAGRLHTARSRNDQVALDLHLYVIRSVSKLIAAIRALQSVLADRAEQHVDAIMPGYTHLQPAQPITVGFHLIAYCFMFQRDRQRLVDAERRADCSPLGAAALAGTTFPIDPHMVASELNLSGVYDNAADAVSDRDFVIETTAALALTCSHLSRLATDIILWASPGFGFCELPDELATGSSIMPQKKNPDVPELIRSRAGRVWSALTNLGFAVGALPLAYNRDLQETKQPLIEAVDTTAACLSIMTSLIAGIEFNRERMRAATDQGFLTATDLADYLVGRGVPFRDAHRVVGRIVRYCIDRGLVLTDLDHTLLREFHDQFQPDATEVLCTRRAVCRRSSPGGTAPARVSEQIARARALIQHP